MELLVTIAIPDLAGTAARAATLASLACHTPEPYEVVLFIEETSGQNVAADSGNATYRQITVSAPLSVPAALNRLLAACTTPFILLLESGTIVTAGWLERLLVPLSDPSIGLTGPSTNISWNEQQVVVKPGNVHWSREQIDAYAANIARRYRGECRPLDTLHSLGDFCYLFKREVAEQLGGFDEAYGAGPCWEIDFNTRAARAGFRAVWVADAYVHRAPSTPTKNQLINRLFIANKHLYQDRFCGLRLRGAKTGYEAHCRGEACEHFAPHNLIQITLRPGDRQDPSQVPSSGQENEHNAQSTQDVIAPVTENRSTTNAQPEPVISPTSDLPLISCIMPTRDRRLFVRQAIAYFEQQDYPNRELIIVDDGDDRISDLVPPDARVHYIALSKPVSIGAKRNMACEQAHGAIIAHWDDDDWYASHRLRHQATPLLDKRADITGLETSCFFDLANWQTWTCTPDLHRHLFVGDVHGGTLVYWRYVWERMARYPTVSVAEDALFLRQACRQGARLHKLPHANSFVYIRHTSNAWKFPLGLYLMPAGWQRCELDTFLPSADLPFYMALSPAAPANLHTPSDASRQSAFSPEAPGDQDLDLPLVSCIMPTYNRRHYVPQAIQYFLRQEYPNRELLIIDDGSEPAADLVPDDPRIRYIRLDTRMILGAKRNLACKLAHGTIIAHWDDDDWIAPHRLRYQIDILEQAKADLCGASRQLYYSPTAQRAWLYEYPATIRHWLAGNTLCYRKTFWEQNPFPDIAIGEDTRFIWSPKAQNAVVVPEHTFYVGLVHEANTSRKNVQGTYWHPHSVAEVQRLLGADLAFYHS